jgi:hypothetical protein
MRPWGCYGLPDWHDRHRCGESAIMNKQRAAACSMCGLQKSQQCGTAYTCMAVLIFGRRSAAVMDQSAAVALLPPAVGAAVWLGPECMQELKHSNGSLHGEHR